jgi:nucleoside-diphosphate-sugar epimerase
VKCLVTGASGFIGAQLCRQLQARGDDVVATSRCGASLPDGTATIALDLATNDFDSNLLVGVDTVFHLAGIAHTRAPAAKYERVNFQATVALAAAARSAGVRCFVFLSSVKAMGPAGSAAVRAEADVAPPQDAYGLSKWHAECALRESGHNSAMAVVILRPALVYGAQAKGNLALLAKAARRGLPRPPAGGARSMIARADLVSLLLLLTGLELSGVHTWIATDGQQYTTRRVYDALRSAQGASPTLAWLPSWCWRGAAALYDLWRGEQGDSTSLKLFGDERYSNGALIAATGWQPSQTLESVLHSASVMPLEADE